MEIVEKPLERDVFRIHLRPQKPEGSRDIVLKEVVASHQDGGFQVGPISLTIRYGDRIAILGLNGSGKSTLLNTISGQLRPISGAVLLGKALRIGNLMQEHDNLPREESIKDFLMKRAGVSVQDVYALTTRFGFDSSEVDKKVSTLSPGGRARILFALFSALSANVLLLDEPTNHLDLEALEALDEAVAHYNGTIILVSHDRYFLERLHSTDIYVLTDGKLVRQEGLDAYLTTAEKEAERLLGTL